MIHGNLFEAKRSVHERRVLFALKIGTRRGRGECESHLGRGWRAKEKMLTEPRSRELAMETIDRLGSAAVSEHLFRGHRKEVGMPAA